MPSRRERIARRTAIKLNPRHDDTPCPKSMRRQHRIGPRHRFALKPGAQPLDLALNRHVAKLHRPEKTLEPMHPGLDHLGVMAGPAADLILVAAPVHGFKHEGRDTRIARQIGQVDAPPQIEFRLEEKIVGPHHGIPGQNPARRDPRQGLAIPGHDTGATPEHFNAPAPKGHRTWRAGPPVRRASAEPSPPWPISRGARRWDRRTAPPDPSPPRR